MRAIFTKLLLLLTLFSGTLFADHYEKELRNQNLRKEIDLLLSSKESQLQLGVQIVSLETGELIYEKNADKPFVPASLAKLFVSGAAFSKLKTNFCFETKLFYEGVIKNGELQGDLYLQGSGDPSLTTQDLEQLALQVRLLGIKSLKGAIVVDPSIFDQVAMGPGWMWDEEPSIHYSNVDGLLVNHACISIWAAPSELNKKPTILLYPEMSNYRVQNSAITADVGEGFQVVPAYLSAQNPIEITGALPLKAMPKEVILPVKEPHLYTGILFKNLIQKQGVNVEKAVLRAGTLSPKAQLIAKHSSAKLPTLVQVLMKRSDNLYADALFKKLGEQELMAPGTWEKGGEVVRQFLEKDVQLSTKDLVVRDGSGLTRYNMVSPKQFVNYLCWIDQQGAFREEFISALPISGVDGTLKNRMKTIPSKVRAKTGSMTGIATLGGFIEANDGERFVFCIMINNFTGSGSKYREEIEDRFCELVVNR